MARTITILNPGIGGDAMNEVLVEIPTPPVPTPPAPGNSLVKHPIVTLGGEEADDLIQPIDSVPTGSEMALPVRQVGTVQVEGVVGGIPLAVDITIGDTVTTNQGTPNTDPNSWPVHQVGTPPLASNAATETTLALIKLKTDNLDVLLSSRAVTGLTDAQLRATPVPVSGTVTATGPLTDAQLRAVPVPVSGPLTQAQLEIELDEKLGDLGQKTMALSAPMVIASDQSPIPITGTITASDASVGLTGAASPGSTQQNGGTDGASLRANRMFDLDTGAGSEHNLGVSLRKAASGGSVEAGTSADPLRVDPTGTTTQPVSAVALPLPAGAATSALQTAGNASLTSIDTDFDVALSTRASQATLAAVAASVASIDTDVDVALSTRNAEATQLLVKAKTDNLDVALSTRASEATLATRASEATLALIKAKTDNLDVALSTRASEATLATRAAASQLPAALVGGRLDENLGAWLGSTAPTVGQKTAAASIPVVIASDQEVNVDVGVPDKTAFTYGTTVEQPIGGVYQDTAPTLLAGTTGAVRVTAERALHQNLRDAAGAELATAGNPARVDPTGTTTQPVSAASLPLPTGAATEATLALIKAKTDNLDVALSTRSVTGLTDAQLRASAVPVDVSDRAARLLGVLSTGANTIGKVDQGVGGASAWKVDGSAVTQPVSAAALPLPAGAATSALQTQPGVDIGDVTINNAAGASAVNIQDGGNSITVDGTVAVSGSVAVTGPLTDAQLRATPVPISGTVTANLGTVDGLALDATLTGGTAKAIARGGAKGATVAADVTSTAEGADHQGLDVQLYHGGVAKDPTAIRALTSADVVTAAQGTAAAAGAPWSQRLSDGAAFYDAAKTGQLPAALVGGRLDENVGAWLGSTAPTVGQKAGVASLPVVLASDQTPVPGAASAAGVNTSTTPLGIAGVFTGTGEEVKDYAFITVQVFADQASATDGLSFQWSGDNTNWDTANGTSVLASAGRAFAVTPRSRYFRVIYTNGGVAQTVFRLTTIYHPAGTGLISLPLDQSLTEENLAQTVRAILAAKDASGNFQNLTANPNKSLAVGDIGTRVTAGKYGAATGRIAGTVAAQNIATLANPAASGKTVYVRRITVACVSGASAQTPYEYTLARTTAAVTAGGTVLTSQKRDTADATAVGVARSGAVTATAAAGALWTGPGATSAATAVTHPLQLLAWESRRDDDDIVLAAGEALLVSAEGNDTDLNHIATFFWQEV